MANLAVSDFCLCTITMPLTLVEVLYQRWQWGNRHVHNYKSSNSEKLAKTGLCI